MEGTCDAPSGFRILFVCTGNICRSPLAERLTRSVLSPSFQVNSAGTHAVAGLPMADRAQRELVRLGGDPSGFASRTLTAELVAESDLVLTGTIKHRADTAALHPVAASRIYTIVEFGTLAEAVEASLISRERHPVRRAHALVHEVKALRGLVQVNQPDIPDPFGGSRWAYRTAGRRIARALAVPLRLLTLQPASRSSL